ncbi:muts domain V [Myxozyma melibiosi]|uniref:Muts domain V n=1 Tax=Myxozyma melibiosi TaxID=54550 RepID=A0ABR1F7R8_9ASCO
MDLDALAKAYEVVKTYPTVLQQAKDNMERLPKCVVLTRVGSFYELYFHQADEFGPLLNLRVAQKKTQHGPVSMAGFPFMHLDRYLKILVQELHQYVAISDEFPNIYAKPGAPQQAALAKNLVNPEDYMDKNEIGQKTANMFIRRVCRIITPGTLIDEKFLNPTENNFIVAISLRPKSDQLVAQSDGTDDADAEHFHIGLSWLDFSTGDFFTQVSSNATLISDIARIAPSEILVDKGLNSGPARHIYRKLEEQQYFITMENFPELNEEHAQGGESSEMDDGKLNGQKRDFLKDWNDLFESEESAPDMIKILTHDELNACTVLLRYIRDKLPETSIKVQVPVRRVPDDNMLIDVNSLRALEIKKTLREQLTSGSLLNTIKRTVTKSGTRLLSDWLSSPTTSIAVINQRQNLVESFLNDDHVLQMVILYLKRTHDANRVVQRLALGRGDAEDMIALLQSIQQTAKLRELLADYVLNKTEENEIAGPTFQQIVDRLADLSDLERLIVNAFDQELVFQRLTAEEQRLADEMARLEQGVADLNEVGEIKKPSKKKPQTRKGAPIEMMEIMKRNASRSLMRLHNSLRKSIAERDKMERDLKEQLDAPTIDLRWAPGLGFYVHAAGKDFEKFESVETEYGNTEARCIIARKNTRSYHLDRWTVVGSRIDSYKMMIRVEERKIFNDIRQQVVAHLAPIRRNARVLDELDVTSSFAVFARERQLVRPVVHNRLSHHIVAGRHSTVEYGLAKKGVAFTPNDCFLDEKERLWLITGPNMGGKSTFLRQNALISILAQVGSYVPADFAELGIVDQIFSRVGSADNLYRDESTFMVEMLETAAILKHATPRSFVIMDEIGRGTTPMEGLSIAYAALHHLYHVNKCRTLFATHFHDLGEMIEDMPHAASYCTDLSENELGLYFDHRLRKGVNHLSHGIHVARLAGLPAAALEVAEATLIKLDPLGSAARNGRSDDSGAGSTHTHEPERHESVASVA